MSRKLLAGAVAGALALTPTVASAGAVAGALALTPTVASAATTYGYTCVSPNWQRLVVHPTSATQERWYVFMRWHCWYGPY